MTTKPTMRNPRRKALSKFEQGFICAIASLMNGHGLGTEVEELYYEIGSPTPQQARAAGMGEYEIDALARLHAHMNAEG